MTLGHRLSLVVVLVAGLADLVVQVAVVAALAVVSAVDLVAAVTGWLAA